MKPSNFTIFPSDSVLHNYESEKVARNIMVILARTGDSFRYLGWDEYKSERLQDGHFTEGERRHYDMVWRYCTSSDTVVLFSSKWAGVK